MGDTSPRYKQYSFCRSVAKFVVAHSFQPPCLLIVELKMLAARVRSTTPASTAACGAFSARPRAVALLHVVTRPVASASSKPRMTIVAHGEPTGTMESEPAIVAFCDAKKMPAFVDGQINKFPLESGVFAVYDKDDVLRFVGISRNISLSITEHAKSLGDRVHSVKAGVIPSATKESLTTAWKDWLQAAVCTNFAL